MRDCRDIFHDDKLYENLDENPNHYVVEMV